MNCNITLEELKNEAHLITKNGPLLTCGSCGYPIGQHRRKNSEFLMLETAAIKKKEISFIGTNNSNKVCIFLYSRPPIMIDCENLDDALNLMKQIKSELS